MTELKATCNQCFSTMQTVIVPSEIGHHFCTNPECPNFALLQVGAEFLDKE